MEFNLRERLSVLQALDEVGRVLYPDAWTGLEPWATPSEDPKVVLAAKEQAAKCAKEAKKAADDAKRDVEFAQSDETMKAAQKRYLNAYRAFRVEESAFLQFPVVFDGWEQSHECFQRRQGAEKELFGAFGSRAVRLLYKSENEVPWDSWVRQKGFRLYTSLSTMREPRQMHGGPIVQDDRDRSVSSKHPKRDPIRHAVFVQKDEFEFWLLGQEWARDALLNSDPVTQCRVHLTKLESETPEDRKRLRNECKKHCQSRVQGVTEKHFDEAWKTVPKFWREKGRPKENSVMHIDDL